MATKDEAFPSEQALAQIALEKLRALCKGNGLRPQSITVKQHNISTHALQTGTYLELKPAIQEKTIVGRSVVGTLATSREDALRQIDQAMVSAANDPATRTKIAATLLNRPDKGFGLAGEILTLDFLRREFTYHESCGSCRGSGSGACTRCHGRKTEHCSKCSGRGMMNCPDCRGLGMIQGTKCHRCQGQRYTSCDTCHRSGQMGCRNCNATGVAKCTDCGGNGTKSHVLSMAAGAATYFDYDGKSIPQNAADMIESHGAALARSHKIRLEGRVPDDENVLGVTYDTTFPYGDIVFQAGRREITCGVFGYKADFTNFPLILDKMIHGGEVALEVAASGQGAVVSNIKKASRYRLIAQGFLLANATTIKKARRALLKKYPYGLSATMAEKIVTLADKATGHVTRGPKRQGFVLGLFGVVLLCAAYYVGPLQGLIAGWLPDPRLDFVLDLLLIWLGGFLTGISIRMSAMGAVRTALGHLIPPERKKALMPKGGGLMTLGYVSSAIIAVLMMEIAVQTGGAGSYWYGWLRGMVLGTAAM